MARKLKSDKVLFTATLLLVCTSVVMVYSASAVMAMEQYHDAVPVPVQAGACGRCSASCFVPIVMRIDYRTYRQPVVIWTALGIVALALVAVLFGPPRQRRAPLVRRRPARRAAVRAGEARRDLLHRRAARAADGPHRRGRLLAAADRRRRRRSSSA